MKIKNMTSSSGREVPNQFIIETKGATYFQSYKTVIAKKFWPKNKMMRIYLDKNYWDYSVTTGRYRNDFLGEGIADTRKKIESGEYKLKDLN